jgi:hypothetical protein
MSTVEFGPSFLPELRETKQSVERSGPYHDLAFRGDLPRPWLVSIAFSLMHGAAEDVTAGRMTAEEAPGLITATLLAAFTRRRNPPVIRRSRASAG